MKSSPILHKPKIFQKNTFYTRKETWISTGFDNVFLNKNGPKNFCRLQSTPNGDFEVLIPWFRYARILVFPKPVILFINVTL